MMLDYFMLDHFYMQNTLKSVDQKCFLIAEELLWWRMTKDERNIGKKKWILIGNASSNKNVQYF